MKKILLMLFFVSQSVSAAWVDIGYGTSTSSFFIDFDTLQKNGNFVRVWTKQEYKSPRQTASNAIFQSESFYTEFDCKEKKFRALSSNTYAESELKGGLVASKTTPNPWNFVPPDTIANVMLNIVCKK